MKNRFGRIEDPRASLFFRIHEFKLLHIPKTLNEKRNFLGIPGDIPWNEAGIIILPVPLEMTTTYFKGTGTGPDAILSASHQVELFDDELEYETFRQGILTLEPMDFSATNIEGAVKAVEKTVFKLAETGKRIVILGGEHTVTVGAVRAFRKMTSDLSVLHLDAHAVLRES